MKRAPLATFAVLAVAVAVALATAAGAASLFAPATFKVPYAWQAGGKKLVAGEYTFSKASDTSLMVRHDSTGKEVQVKILEKIPQPTPPITGAQLTFDEVGDFAPSYTEYFTVYVLSEVWLRGEGGFRVHVTKGAHNTKVVKGEGAKK